MYYDHSTCMYYDHNTCMYYDYNTCMYYDHTTRMCYHHSIGVWGQVAKYRFHGLWYRGLGSCYFKVCFWCFLNFTFWRMPWCKVWSVRGKNKSEKLRMNLSIIIIVHVCIMIIIHACIMITIPACAIIII